MEKNNFIIRVFRFQIVWITSKICSINAREYCIIPIMQLGHFHIKWEQERRGTISIAIIKTHDIVRKTFSLQHTYNSVLGRYFRVKIFEISLLNSTRWYGCMYMLRTIHINSLNFHWIMIFHLSWIECKLWTIKYGKHLIGDIWIFWLTAAIFDFALTLFKLQVRLISKCDTLKIGEPRQNRMTLPVRSIER